MAKHRFKPTQRGFTLAEVLIALTVITLISFFVIGAMGPWLRLKQDIDNDRRLQDVRQALQTMYESNAMATEAQDAGRFFDFERSAVDANGNCNVQLTAFNSLKTLLSDSGALAAKDGFGNAWCVFISNPLAKSVDGAVLYSRNIAVVSAGPDGILHTMTRMDINTGVMTYEGDDVGAVISGYDIQYAKLKETLRRLSRVANTYESYFSARFMSYADRDITRDYFSKAYDAAGAVDNTAGTFAPAETQLRAIGVAGSESYSAWESIDGVSNAIMVGNYNETDGKVSVRSPGITGTGALPYTALLTTRLPGPGNAFITRVAVGNY